MYTILAADQHEYGPASATLVRQWIAEGRVNAQTRIKPEGAAEWRTAGELSEFSDLLGTTPASSETLPAPAPASSVTVPDAGAVAVPRVGLAVASLVLGILSLLCGGFILGIPAIIVGHIAHRRTRRSPGEYGGAGFAIAGLVMGYCSVVATALMLAVLMPSLDAAKAKAQSTTCLNNIRRIGLAALIYATDHNGVLPPDFLSMSNALASPKILVCPNDTTRTRATDWSTFTPANVSYEYLHPATKEADVRRTAIFRCPFHGHQGYGDGSVTAGDPKTRQNR
ncbi:MAG: DUF4190 domain-containing protein [Verrucomicrobia bacterium]|nr:DUF4190 domain-containing protein [Verrucomicrobiota bacterium]